MSNRVTRKAHDQVHEVGAAKRGGGYHSDHSVPCEVNLANYQHPLACARKVGAAG